MFNFGNKNVGIFSGEKNHKSLQTFTGVVCKQKFGNFDGDGIEIREFEGFFFFLSNTAMLVLKRVLYE